MGNWGGLSVDRSVGKRVVALAVALIRIEG